MPSRKVHAMDHDLPDPSSFSSLEIPSQAGLELPPLVERPSFEDLYIGIAKNAAERSTCRQLKAGCAITSVDHASIFSLGYNGNARGLANDCDRRSTPCGCLHGVLNALLKLGVARWTEKIIYLTHFCCMQCTKAIINVEGVRRIVYLHEPPSDEMLRILTFTGIEVAEYVPSAYALAE